MAATTKMQPPVNLVHFRLIRSARYPASAAPVIAPSSSDPTTHDSPNVPMCSDLENYGSALPTTPVSKPNKKPPSAASVAIQAVYRFSRFVSALMKLSTGLLSSARLPFSALATPKRRVNIAARCFFAAGCRAGA